MIALALLGARFVLAAVLLAAGAAKLARPGFVDAVRGYGLLPQPLVLPVAGGVVLLELASGGLLAAGLLVGPAATAAAALLVLFGVAMAAALVGGRRVRCGCVGDSSTVVSWRLVARNGALAALAGALAVTSPAGDGGDVPATLVVLATLAALVRLVAEARRQVASTTAASRAAGGRR